MAVIHQVKSAMLLSGPLSKWFPDHYDEHMDTSVVVGISKLENFGTNLGTIDAEYAPNRPSCSMQVTENKTAQVARSQLLTEGL